MRSFILLISMLTTACFSLLADRVDVNTARKIAETVASGNLRSAGSVTLSYAAAAQQKGMLRSAGSDEPADYYVFNIGKSNGFVIVSGLDCTTPVLGYSDEGTFDPDHVNPGLRGMLAYYQRQIAYAEEHQLKAADKDKAVWLQLQSGLSLRSGEILHVTAKWGQEDPYNLYTPVVPETGDHTPSGCGATATAIVLRYFQHPERCVNGVTQQAGQTISYIDYNWASMPLEEPTTDDGKRQVASLMREIGANLDMQYAADGSSSDAALIPKVLKNNFGYNEGGIYYFKENFNWEDWHTMLRSELNKYPVIYRGASSEDGGHIFVVDGYQYSDIYYHINWGWDGYMNGWYALTTMS